MFFPCVGDGDIAVFNVRNRQMHFILSVKLCGTYVFPLPVGET
jgi:hypothetical protein